MKVLVPSYNFNAALGEISLIDFSQIKQEQILLITNTTIGKIIYSFADPNLGAFVSSNVIYLSTDTTSMTDSDSLQIFVEDYFAPSSESTLSSINVEIVKSNTLLEVLTSKQDTFNVDISSVNLNTDEIEDLIRHNNTLLDVLTSVDYTTSSKQDLTNTLLDALTAKDTTVSIDVSAINLNTDNVEQLITDSNTKLDALTSIDYATSAKQDVTNTLLDALTAKETTISLDVSAINLNTDQIEGLIVNSNTRLDVLTAVDYATSTKQDVTNTLLDALTAKETTISLDVSAINLNTDEVETKLDSIDYTLNTINSTTGTIRGDTFAMMADLDEIRLNTEVGTTSDAPLFVNPGALIDTVDSVSIDASIGQTATTALTSRVYIAGSRKVYNLFGISTAGTDQYIQLYNTGNQAPSGTPIGVFFVPANSNFSFDLNRGLNFANNVLVVNSITPVTYTQGNDDLFMTVIHN